MAWPDSADAVISSSATQTTNIESFVSDVVAAAEITLIQNIWANVVTYEDDPEWVDPSDGSTAPQIPATYNVVVEVKIHGDYSAVVAEKILEVKDAIGIS